MKDEKWFEDIALDLDDAVINVNAENGWVKLSVILAAIDAVEGE